MAALTNQGSGATHEKLSTGAHRAPAVHYRDLAGFHLENGTWGEHSGMTTGRCKHTKTKGYEAL